MMAGHRKVDIERIADSLLRPVLRLLIERGLPRQVVDHLVDLSYVEAAIGTAGDDGTDVSPETISAKSGIPKDRARKLLETLEKGHTVSAASLATHSPLIAAAERIMTAWHTDSRFTDTTGRPLPYCIDDAEFVALVRHGSETHGPREISELLLTTRSVSQNDAGELTPNGRHVLAPPHSPEMAFNALEALTDLVNTVAINLEKQPTGIGALQRTCVNDRMPRRVAPLFRAMARETTQAFLESMDDWLVQHEVSDEDTEHQSMVRLGVGVYIVAEE